MSIENLRQTLPDYVKDIKLNLSSVLNEHGAPDLTKKQILAIAMTSAYSAKNAKLIAAMESEAKQELNAEELNAMKTAAIMMGMNNIYYRFLHELEDKTYTSLPAKLRMNVLAKPGIDPVSFELASLAASAINGCGMCMNAHTTQLEKSGLGKTAIQSAIRIASVIHATALTCEIA